MRRSLEHASRLSRVAAARLRADWWRVRGSRIGQKTMLGRGMRIDRPWTVRLGMRCTAEDDVWFKMVSDDSRLTVGDYTFLGRGAEINVLQEVAIGEHVLIGPGCLLFDHNHGLQADLRVDQQACRAAPIRIGDDAWLGARTIVLAGVTIGAQAVVAAGACVNRDVPAGAIVAGIPARVVGSRLPLAEAAR